MKDKMKNYSKDKKKKKSNKFTLKEVVFITISFVFLSSVLTFIFTTKVAGVKVNDKYLNDINKTYSKILSSYYESVDEKELSDTAIDAMMTYLNEKYSIYMDNNSASNLNNKLQGDYQGIGIEIIKYDGSLYVVNVLNNSFAKKAGIIEGDKILKIDDKVFDKNSTTEDVQESSKNKKSITMLVDRDGEEKEFVIEIGNVPIPVVDGLVLNKDDKKIGYIYITSFTDYAYEQFSDKLIELEKENIDSLIIDLRGNSGGYLKEAKEIIEMFIKKGKTLYTLSTKKKNFIVKDSSEESRDYPVAILMNKMTASASEVLAAAMKESYGATLIGDSSYGKGKVQQTDNLSDDDMIKYTVANWLTPKGNNINEVGLTPGISVSLDQKFLENPTEENDNQLQKALEYLSNR